MKILFITSSEEDYLSDGLLIGLRRMYGANCVDYPKRDILYASISQSVSRQIRGHGFTLYSGLLEDIDVDRFHIRPKLERGFFDLVIFSDIWRQFGLFAQWRMYLDPEKTIICDGQDVAQVYPYAGRWWRQPSQWFALRAHKEFLYYKREWTDGSQFNLWHRLVPKNLWRNLPQHKNLRPLSFSIPEEKIVEKLPEKTKDFAIHCVDPEVAEHVLGCKTSYAFENETEYYTDLQSSRFAITTKRAGWDCLRHYEIAANGCIPCFRDLDQKPDTCAPHGLKHMINCISYKEFPDLMESIERLSQSAEQIMRKAAVGWALEHSCSEVARGVISGDN